ncbi:MAG TPA: hypothetical protein VFL43_01280 [Variovorax sp.]|nr:hypothetical protein [Variovorax sp.]
MTSKSSQGGNNLQQGGSQRGGSHEQHVKAGQQSHKGDPGSRDQQEQSGGSRGGASQQHAEPGRQSHKKSS